MSDPAIYPSLKGRTVLVTGGGTGIGASIVDAFARQHSRVAFFDIQEDASRALAAAIAARGHPEPRFVRCDLTDIDALRTAIRTVEDELGPIRALVNNATNDDRHEVDDVDVAYWQDRMDVNLRHYFFAAQAVRKGMASAGGGSIVNLGSITWRLGQSQIVAYATAKAAIAGLSKTLAGEFGPDRIRVTCVEPGLVRTQRQIDNWITPEFEAKVLAGQSLKELIEPEDVASLVLFLAADDSRMCTGQIYVLDAGWT